MAFTDTLKNFFPIVHRDSEYIEMTYATLLKEGFHERNSLACVCVCRDELIQPFMNRISAKWGNAFNCAGLAGMLFVGKTGLIAAHSHAPTADGRERYIYFALPHIAIGGKGEIGLCLRPGRQGRSCACGALANMLDDLNKKALSLRLDFDDIEQSIIKAKLAERIACEGVAHDLLSLTRLALTVIQDDLNRLISLTVNTETSDYAVLSGILIHGPDGDYIAPDKAFFVRRGLMSDL